MKKYLHVCGSLRVMGEFEGKIAPYFGEVLDVTSDDPAHDTTSDTFDKSKFTPFGAEGVIRYNPSLESINPTIWQVSFGGDLRNEGMEKLGEIVRWLNAHTTDVIQGIVGIVVADYSGSYHMKYEFHESTGLWHFC